MTSDYSLSDIAAVSGNNNRGGSGLFGDGNGAWWIVILFLFGIFGWGGMGFGGNNGGAAGAAPGYVLGSDFAMTERKLDTINSGLCDGFYATAQQINGVQAATAQGFASAELSRANQQAALMTQLNAMAMQAQQCCCQTERAIEGVNYNLATQSCETRNLLQTNTRDIIDNANANTRAILDKLTAQEIAAKDAQIAALTQSNFGYQLRASQEAQNNYLISKLSPPCPSPAYVVPNPNCCYNYGVYQLPAGAVAAPVVTPVTTTPAAA